MSQSLLKRSWRVLPQSLRLLFCTCLCCMYAQRRAQAVPATEPLYVCGAFRNTSGLAQGARLYAEHCRQQGKQVLLVDITDAMCMPRNLEPAEMPLSISDAAAMRGPGTVVIHANPPQFQLALCALGKDFLHGKHIVGYWAWELEALPPVWKHALDYVDAVEAPSAFVADTLRPWTQKPVTVRPHPVPSPERCKTKYATDGMLRCLSIFDAGSSWERKNPQAVLEAFAKAFAPGEAELTFKVCNEAAEPERFSQFQTACAATPGVRLLTGTLGPEAMEDLYLRHDVYVSLHRSEGFGLTILEAMRHGLHAVATGWSGNMDFMTGALAHPVPYTLTPMTADTGPCKGLRARWAEPDVEAAAKILRGLRQTLCGKQPQHVASPLCDTHSALKPSHVAVIVLNYNNPGETLGCLSTLYALPERPGLICVVDNASTDDSVATIQKEWALLDDVLPLREDRETTFPPETTALLYTLKENRGYGAGNNAGIRLAQQHGKYRAYWILNNDTRVTENALQALCDTYNSAPGLCMIGSTIVFLHDRKTIQCTAGSSTIGYLGLTFALNAGKKLHQLATLDKDKIEKHINYINGASIFIPESVISEIGFFKEKYFLYLEDVEYGLRARKHGIKLCYAPKSIVYHREGASTGTTSKYNSFLNKTCLVDYLMIRNRTYLVREYYKYLLPLYLATIPLLMLKRLLDGRWRMIPNLFKAIHAGLTGYSLHVWGRPNRFY